MLRSTDLPDDPNEPGHEECVIKDPASNHRLLFIETGDAKQALQMKPADKAWNTLLSQVVRQRRDLRTARLPGIPDLARPGEDLVVVMPHRGLAPR